MGKTLQDFILCNVSNHEASQFHKVLSSVTVLADDGGEISPDVAKVIKDLTKYYDSRDSESLWNKIFGVDEDPLDMTADELERLWGLANQSKNLVEFEFNLTENKDSLPKNKFKDIDDMLGYVKTYASKNWIFFDPNKGRKVHIKPNKEKQMVLYYNGLKEVAVQLLTELGFTENKDPKISDILKQRVKGSTLQGFLPNTDFQTEYDKTKEKYVQQDTRYQADSIFMEHLVTLFNEKYKDYADTFTLSKAQDTKKGKTAKEDQVRFGFNYTGPRNFALKFLTSSFGISDLSAETLVEKHLRPVKGK